MSGVPAKTDCFAIVMLTRLRNPASTTERRRCRCQRTAHAVDERARPARIKARTGEKQDENNARQCRSPADDVQTGASRAPVDATSANAQHAWNVRPGTTVASAAAHRRITGIKLTGRGTRTPAKALRVGQKLCQEGDWHLCPFCGMPAFSAQPTHHHQRSAMIGRHTLTRRDVLAGNGRETASAENRPESS